MRLLPFALALSLVGTAGCRKESSGGGDVWSSAAIHKAKERGTLIVLTEVPFVPFEYKDERGELTGFDVDLARELAKEAGLAIEFRDKKFEELQGELDRGMGDFLISGMTITGERGFTVSFTKPYFLTRTLTLLARPKADGVKRLSDLNAGSRRVVAKLGTTGETASHKRLPDAQIYTLGDEALCALEVAQGRADAFVYDDMQIRRYAADHPDTTRVLEEAVTVEPYGIACKKGDVETVAWLDMAIDLMRRDGRFDALYAKYFPGQSPPK